MKKQLLFLIALVTFVTANAASPFTFSDSKYYKLDETTKTATLSNAAGTASPPKQNSLPATVIIPDAIEKDGETYTVTGISDGYFRTKQQYTKEIILPSTLKSIGSSCFLGLTSLTGIDLPDGLESIGKQAFNNLSNLTGTLNVPASVKSVGNKAFAGTGFSEVVINSPDTWDAGQEDASWFYGCPNLANVSIPSTWTLIPRGTFQNCTKLTEIALPENLETIGRSAFAGSALTEVTIPASVTSIANYAFSSSALKSVNIQGDDNPLSIGMGAFNTASPLEEVRISRRTPPAYVDYDRDEQSVESSESLKTDASTEIYLDNAAKDQIDAYKDSMPSLANQIVEGVSGVTSIEADAATPVRYFMINGVEVNPMTLTSGMYIKVEGPKTSKIIIK